MYPLRQSSVVASGIGLLANQFSIVRDELKPLAIYPSFLEHLVIGQSALSDEPR